MAIIDNGALKIVTFKRITQFMLLFNNEFDQISLFLRMKKTNRKDKYLLTINDKICNIDMDCKLKL